MGQVVPEGTCGRSECPSKSRNESAYKAMLSRYYKTAAIPLDELYQAAHRSADDEDLGAQVERLVDRAGRYNDVKK